MWRDSLRNEVILQRTCCSSLFDFIWQQGALVRFAMFLTFVYQKIFSVVELISGNRSVARHLLRFWNVVKRDPRQPKYFLPSRGVPGLDDARGKKQIWCPHVRTWGLAEANVLYWRKYLRRSWDFSALPPVNRRPWHCVPLPPVITTLLPSGKHIPKIVWKIAHFSLLCEGSLEQTIPAVVKAIILSRRGSATLPLQET